jgi:hypothetical protein
VLDPQQRRARRTRQVFLLWRASGALASAIEVTGNARFARILDPRVARVIVGSPGDTGIR